MRKIITYELTYFKKGDELKKTIPIKFISNGVHDDYIVIAQRANEIMALTAKRADLIKDLAWICTDRKKTFSERKTDAKKIKHELKQIEDDLLALDGKAFLEDRFKLIATILSDNGITDPELNDIRFWNKHTEPSEAWGFLAAVVMKDYEQSKKKAT